MIYGQRTNGKEHGTVFTKREIVDLILDLVGYNAEKDLSNIIVIDPSVGEGAFFVPLLKRLVKSSLIHSFELNRALENIHLVELDHAKIEKLKLSIKNLLIEANVTMGFPTIHEGDYLEIDCPKADIIIGNPPYVRYDNLPEEKKEKYKILFSTFKYRADIYVPFIEKSLKTLKENGRLSFICADRWLKNQYGIVLRKLIINNYHMSYYLPINGIQAFEEEVLAYPSIFMIENHSTGLTKKYEISSDNDINIKKIISTNNNISFDSEGYLLSDNIDETHQGIEEQGFKIRIGVATGADRVFIGKELPKLIENELLLPIITSKDLYKGTIVWGGRYIFNPFYKNTSSLINIEEYPMLKKYLEENAQELRLRYISTKNGEKWYKTIDRIYPDITYTPKLLFPDITTQRYLYIDEGKYYPHHNFYYITGAIEDLYCLGAILLSDYCIEQLITLGNTMSGGAYRWQAQTLRKIKIPKIVDINEELKGFLMKAFSEHDIISINKVVNDLTKL